MAKKLIGYYKGNFTDVKTGKNIEYVKAWASEAKDGVVGERTYEYKVSVSAFEALSKLKPGTSFEPLFDQYGRVIQFDLH